MAKPSASYAAPSLSQHRLHIEPGRLQRGQKPEQHTDDARGTERERKHAQIDHNGIESRNVLRSQRDEQAGERRCQYHAHEPARQREDDALDEHLAHLAFPCLLRAPSERPSRVACLGAREQKAGNVRARDQQDESDGAEEHGSVGRTWPTTLSSSGTAPTANFIFAG